MTHEIVFLESDAAVLYDCDGCTVDATYDLGPAGHAARVHIDDDEAFSMESVSGVLGHEADDVTFAVRTAEATTDDVATIEDIQSLHNIPASDRATGAGVSVVVMDSGIDRGHQLFQGEPLREVDVSGYGRGDAVGHGTGVAGLIRLLAPGVEFTSLRIFGNEGSTDFHTILSAYEWLFANADSVDVVNMSWGASRKVAELDRIHEHLQDVDIRDVVAAGNSGDAGGSPATASGAFSAGACTKDGRMAPFSSADDYDNPDVVAIGVNVKLAQARGTTMGVDIPGPWVAASGTSFSAPIVSALVARYLERESGGSLEVFEKHADDLTDSERDGAGIADYGAVLAAGVEDVETVDATVWSLWDNGYDIIHIDENFLADGKYTVKTVERSDGSYAVILSPE